jgi:oligosaccharide repeat unit polymerase
VEVSLALAFVGSVVLLATRVAGGSIFAPWSLYTIGQVFTLAIAYLKLDPNMTDFTLATWLVWGGSALAFYLGCIAGNLFPQSRSVTRDSVVMHRTFTYWMLGVLAVYGFGVVMGLAKVGAWPMMTRHPEENRLVFQAGIWTGQLQHLCWVLLVAAPLWAIRGKGLVRLLALILFAIAFSYGVLAGFRLVLMFGVVSLLLAWDLQVRRIAVLKVAVVVVVFIAATSILMIQRMTGSLVADDQMVKVGTEIATKGAYSYLANNFWNLDFAVSRQLGPRPHPLTLGGLTFLTPMVYLGMAGKFAAAYGWDSWMNEGSLKTTALNTISYQWLLIKEGGWPAVVLFPFGWGVVSSHLYAQIVKQKSDWAHLLYTPVAFSLAFCFFLFMYQTPMYWQIAASFAVLRLLTRSVDAGPSPTSI